MQLSQTFSIPKSSFKGVSTFLIVAGVSASIIQHRPEPLLIPLGVIPFVARKLYVDNQKEKESSQLQINSLESELAHSLELEQQQQFLFLELQQENSTLKNNAVGDRKFIQQLQQQNKSLESSLEHLQESVTYYEEEIVNENHALDKQNKLLKQTVKGLKLEQELWQQDKTKLLAEIKAIARLKDRSEPLKQKARSINLSDRKLAIVGGHPKIQNAVINRLKQEYNLGEAVTIPSDGKEKRITQQHITDALKNCDYIVMITGNLASHIKKVVNKLNSKNHLTGNLLTITNSRGESGVLREINKHLDTNCI